MMFETNRAGDLNTRTETDAPTHKKNDAPVIGDGELHLPEQDAVILTDGGTTSAGDNSLRFLDLVGFRRDMLLTLACFGPTHGQGLRAHLARVRNEDVNDGRFYPHLNALVDHGLIEKRENEHDERSHEYEISKRGRESIRQHAQRLTGAVEALGGGAR